MKTPDCNRTLVVPKKYKKQCNFKKGEHINTSLLVPSTLGQAIKIVRHMRNITQKDLGLAVGFPIKSADVRIAQYESGQRTPKPDLLHKIEDALNCKFEQISYIEYTLF